jgi:hypothetical protein
VQKGTPWPIQSAFISAALYFFLVKDRDGWIGQGLRSLVGDLPHATVASIVCGMQVITLSSQVIFDNPNANYFTPIHNFFYALLRLQGPPEAVSLTTVPATGAASSAPVVPAESSKPAAAAAAAKKSSRMTFDEFVVYFRYGLLAVLGVVLLAYRVPRVSLPAVAVSEVFTQGGESYVRLSASKLSGLGAGEALGVCQWAPLLPLSASLRERAGPLLCQPYALRLEEATPLLLSDACRNISSKSPDAQRASCLEGGSAAAASAIAASASAGGVRLAMYSAAPLHSAAPSSSSNMRWSSELPASDMRINTAKFSDLSLYLGTDSAVYVVSNPQFSGSIFDPAAMTAKLVWRGLPRSTCGDSEAAGLGLDPSSGLPLVRCSDGTQLWLDIGSVATYAPATAASSSSSSSSSVQEQQQQTVQRSFVPPTAAKGEL